MANCVRNFIFYSILIAIWNISKRKEKIHASFKMKGKGFLFQAKDTDVKHKSSEKNDNYPTILFWA